MDVALLPPDVQAPTTSASSVAPRAALRMLRMGPPSAVAPRRQANSARRQAGTIPAAFGSATAVTGIRAGPRAEPRPGARLERHRWLRPAARRDDQPTLDQREEPLGQRWPAARRGSLRPPGERSLLAAQGEPVDDVAAQAATGDERAQRRRRDDLDGRGPDRRRGSPAAPSAAPPGAAPGARACPCRGPPRPCRGRPRERPRCDAVRTGGIARQDEGRGRRSANPMAPKNVKKTSSRA